MSWHKYERIHSEILIEKEQTLKDLESNILNKIISQRHDENTLVYRITELLRGKTLTRDSIRRITEVLYDCSIYKHELQRIEEWKRIAREKYLCEENKEKYETNIQLDFIEEREMEL